MVFSSDRIIRLEDALGILEKRITALERPQHTSASGDTPKGYRAIGDVPIAAEIIN